MMIRMMWMTIHRLVMIVVAHNTQNHFRKEHMIIMKIIIVIKTLSKIIDRMKDIPVIQHHWHCQINAKVKAHRDQKRVIVKIIWSMNMIQKLKKMKMNNFRTNIWAKIKILFHLCIQPLPLCTGVVPSLCDA